MCRNGRSRHSTLTDTTRCSRTSVRRHIVGSLTTYQAHTSASTVITRWYFARDNEGNNFKIDEEEGEEDIFQIIKLYKYQVQSISGLN